MPTTKFPLQIGGFEILGSLGHGGMGIVYCGRDNTLQRELAIKVQTGDWERHPELLQRFLREARILAAINHPNVVQIYSVGEHDGAPFFAMELLEGSIADAARLKMPGIPQLKRWILEAARGLAAIHEMGVVHRDIKPGNLLLTRQTSVEEEHVKVADLGIASGGGQFGGSLTRVGAVLGTSGYLAPEAFRRERTLDSRADQYSLGVVFFELLARRAPYQDIGDRAQLAASFEPRSAPDVREYRPEVDAATAQILARMLQDNPDDRFETTTALVQALTLIQSISASQAPVPHDANGSRLTPPAQITAQSPPAADTASRWKAAALAGLALLLGSLAILWQASRSPDREVAPTTGPVPLPATSAAPTADSMHREAWAKYLLGRYRLKSWAEDDVWTLVLREQNAGLLSAELTGPEAQPIALQGRVESQSTQAMDGEDWDVYQLRLSGAAGAIVELRVEFSESSTSGEGAYVRDGQRLRFDVEDSDDL